MNLDENGISPLQSETIKAAIKGLIINGLTIATVITGKAFDIEAIKTGIDLGVPMLINVASTYYYYKAIKGRMSATKLITKE